MGFVFDFSAGNKDLRDLLGGKGANLAEMTNLGLPVPPGFTITTEACRAYLQRGGEPEGLAGGGAERAGALGEHMRRAGGGAGGAGGGGDRAARGAREDHGPHLGRSRRPAAGERALGGEVLDA